MGATLIERLFHDGDTPPTDEYIRQIGIMTRFSQIRPALGDIFGTMMNVPGMTNKNQLGQRSTLPICIFDGTSQFGLDSFNFNDSTTAGGAIAFNSSGFARLSCTTASGDEAIRQSKPYMPYRVGRTLQTIIGIVLGAKKTNVRQRVGLFDANDGYFFEQDSSNLKVVSRIGAVDTTVNQSLWNIDSLNGTGVSAYNIDTSDFQQFVIEYIYGGIIRFGVMSEGLYFPCHEIYTENTLTNAGINKLFLPIRTEITNTGTAASSTNLDLFFMAAYLEGGTDDVFSLGAGAAITTTGRSVASGATVPLISIRLKSAFARGFLVPRSVTSGQTGTYRANILRIVYGGTLTGAAFATASNGVEFDVAATAITGGTTLYNSLAQATSQPDVNLPALPPASSNFAGTADIISVSAFNITGSTATIFAGINWRELV